MAFLAWLCTHYTENLEFEVLKMEIATNKKCSNFVHNLATELVLSIIGGAITVPPLTRSKKITNFLVYFQNLKFLISVDSPFLVLMMIEDSDEKPSSL